MDAPRQDLRAELAAARARSAEYLDLAQRAHAELLSYRQRVERERADEHQTGRADAVEQILPVLDDLDRALGHLPPDLANHPWVKGVMLLGLRLQSTLAELGIERLGAVGDPFDPTVHEAVGHEPRPNVESEHVAEVVRPGYRSGDRLIRPAQVIVARERKVIDTRV